MDVAIFGLVIGLVIALVIYAIKCRVKEPVKAPYIHPTIDVTDSSKTITVEKSTSAIKDNGISDQDKTSFVVFIGIIILDILSL